MSSIAEAMQVIFTFVFAFAKSWFSHELAHTLNNNNNNNDLFLRGGSVGQVQSSLRSSVKTTCTNIYNYNTTIQEWYTFRTNLNILLQNVSSIPKVKSGPHLLPIQDILFEIVAVNLHF